MMAGRLALSAGAGLVAASAVRGDAAALAGRALGWPACASHAHRWGQQAAGSVYHAARCHSGAAASTSGAAGLAGAALAAAQGSGAGLGWREQLRVYKQLSKFRLSALVVSTAAAGFVMGAHALAPCRAAPWSAVLCRSIGPACTAQRKQPLCSLRWDCCATGSGEEVDWRGLAWTSLGTLGCAAAANTLNQVYEAANDALMKRTMRRPLPTGRVTRQHALLFAGAAGVAGVAVLFYKARRCACLPRCTTILSCTAGRLCSSTCRPQTLARVGSVAGWEAHVECCLSSHSPDAECRA